MLYIKAGAALILRLPKTRQKKKTSKSSDIRKKIKERLKRRFLKENGLFKLAFSLLFSPCGAASLFHSTAQGQKLCTPCFQLVLLFLRRKKARASHGIHGNMGLPLRTFDRFLSPQE